MKIIKKEECKDGINLVIFGFIKIRYRYKNKVSLQNYFVKTSIDGKVNSKIYPEAKIENMSSIPENISIGEHTHIRGRLLVYPKMGKITIGDYCYVGENSNIWSAISITIGDNVLIAHDVDIFDHDTHPIDPVERHEHYKAIIEKGHPDNVNWNVKEVVIKNNAWIGTKAIILRGITIGKGAVVAAGSVVTKDVEPYTIVAGNPAKFIKKVEQKM